MAHPEQKDFCTKVKDLYPQFFKNCKVLDVGSLDVNGNNKYLFEDCEYTGIDIGLGNNVDIVSKGHEFNAPDNSYDTIISTECFEHDMYYRDTIQNIIRMLRPGGLFLFTCATRGRGIHGTRSTSAWCAPLLAGDWADYYKNLVKEDIQVIPGMNIFSVHEYSCNDKVFDLYFYGIKDKI